MDLSGSASGADLKPLHQQRTMSRERWRKSSGHDLEQVCILQFALLVVAWGEGSPIALECCEARQPLGGQHGGSTEASSSRSNRSDVRIPIERVLGVDPIANIAPGAFVLPLLLRLMAR
jgi:hypothetical protein